LWMMSFHPTRCLSGTSKRLKAEKLSGGVYLTSLKVPSYTPGKGC
jgi:hypothetical protein